MQGHGYRFIEAVVADGEARSRAELLELLAPDRAWGEGLAALESFDHGQLTAARAMLSGLVTAHPREVRFRIVQALICALLFDSTRTDAHPDVAALQEAEAYAACALNPDLAECWATLGFVLERTGDRVNALVALRRAVRIESSNYLHHGRLAGASWGQERLRAVRDALRTRPFVTSSLRARVLRQRVVRQGRVYLMVGDSDAAREAFLEALTLVPGHALARAGLAILDGPESDAARSLGVDTSPAFDLVMAQAALLVHSGDVPAAAAMIHAALAAAPPGNTGWLIPLDPPLHVWEHRAAWAAVLDALHVRAR